LPRHRADPQRRQRRRGQEKYEVPEDLKGVFNGAESVPTAGISPEVLWDLIRECQKNQEVAQFVTEEGRRIQATTANTTWDLTFLSQAEGLRLQSMARSMRPGTVPEPQTGDPGDVPPNPAPNPWDEQGTPPPPAQGDAGGTTESFGPDTTTDHLVSVDDWVGPPPPETDGEEQFVGRFVNAFSLALEPSAEPRVLITCPVLEEKPVYPFLCNHCLMRYDDMGNPCPAWERVS
jgi:hypothetical protein